MLAVVRVESSSDAGCEWSDADQSNFCAAVVAHLSYLYPGVQVEYGAQRVAPVR